MQDQCMPNPSSPPQTPQRPPPSTFPALVKYVKYLSHLSYLTQAQCTPSPGAAPRMYVLTCEGIRIYREVPGPDTWRIPMAGGRSPAACAKLEAGDFTSRPSPPRLPLHLVGETVEDLAEAIVAYPRRERTGLSVGLAKAGPV